jgi:hypothetical protein
MASLYRMGWASVAALAGIWAGSVTAQTIDFGQTLPSVNSAVPLVVQNVGAPADLGTLNNSAGLGQYVVYVNGDSNLLLQQVRRVEPGAFRRSYNNRQVIQAGRFATLAGAEERVTELENRGILSEIATLNATASPTTPTPVGSATGGSTTVGNLTAIPLDTAPVTTLDFVAPTSNNTPGAGFAQNLALAQSSTHQNPSYYVAIPSKPGELANLSAQLTATGINSSLILARASRRGAFIAVGPYSDRLSAEVMVASIKNAGFKNARVYFGY